MKGRRHLISCSIPALRRTRVFIVIFLILVVETIGQPHHHRQQRCSNRLENALEHMRRRSAHQIKSSRSIQTPYDLYYSLYGQQYDPDENTQGQFNNYNSYMPFDGEYIRRGYYAKNIHRVDRNTEDDNFWEQHARHKLTVSRVEVEDLKVRLPAKPEARWVEVDKCKFSTENATLDTRLIFPDLTISGKVILQPTGGKCNMILRLRHAGIEFHTTPIGFDISHNEESRRLGSATVRTDSHFAEPGFLSVFAHGCQGPSGIRVRQNSKRRFGFNGGETAQPDVELSEPHIVVGTKSGANKNRWRKREPIFSNYDIRSGLKFGPTGSSGSSRFGEENLDFNDYEANSREGFHNYDPEGDNFYHRQQGHRYRRDAESRNTLNTDEMNFNDDILNFSDKSIQDIIKPDARSFASLLGGGGGGGGNGGDEVVGDALSGELEKVFSMGVRGLLTTYMQRALQPAIKETLMENMGYRLSYG